LAEIEIVHAACRRKTVRPKGDRATSWRSPLLLAWRDSAKPPFHRYRPAPRFSPLAATLLKQTRLREMLNEINQEAVSAIGSINFAREAQAPNACLDRPFLL
jgi:hypothetical protein